MPQIMEEITEVIQLCRSWCLVPQIMEEITEVIQLGRSWRLVPQIMEEITEVIQLGRSWCRATDHGRNRDGSEVPQVQFLWLWSSL